LDTRSSALELFYTSVDSFAADAVILTGSALHAAMVEINLERGASAEQEVPVSYNGFVFVIGGSVRIGETTLNTGQVGWLDRPTDNDASIIRVVAGESGARLILYAGQPQGGPIVSYGRFIGDTKQDIARLFAEYQVGQFPRPSELKKTGTLTISTSE
jgi:quercetin 2,3-dioxygenase